MKWLIGISVLIATIGFGVAFAWALGAFEDYYEDEEDDEDEEDGQ